MKKLLFVMNPCAGMRKANKVLPDILGLFNRYGYDVHVHITEGRGDGAEVVAQRAGEMDLIVCCGGDGTFNETVSGILKSGTQVPVGYIPAGSTNDFAVSLGLKSTPMEAAKAIMEGSEVPYDVGCFGGRYFTYVASFGIFTKASYATPQSMKNSLGHAAYLLEGIQELSQLKKLPVKMELDGEVFEGEYLFGAISNSTSMGGVLKLDPKQVDMADGLFEIMLVRMPKDLMELSECITAIQKQNYNCKMMTFRTAKKVKVYAQDTMDWTLDGEREPGHREVEVENLHLAITLKK